MSLFVLMIGIAIILAAVMLKRIPGGDATEETPAPAASPKLLRRKGPFAEPAAALAAAKRVVVVPGYGLGAAQAQSDLRELVDALRARGVQAHYVVHPVAGRMPGHMNALLDDAMVPHDQVHAAADGDPVADVALVVGANDVVNPAPAGALSGLRTVDLSRVGRVIALKRGAGLGHAGEPNDLFSAATTTLLRGDLKANLAGLSAEVAALATT